VDHDCPELDEDEEEEVIELLEGENKWEEMVWYGLLYVSNEPGNRNLKREQGMYEEGNGA